MLDEITMDVEILSISESTPEVSKNLSWMIIILVGCNGSCLLKNAHETCFQSMATHSTST